MSCRLLLTGPRYSQLESQAFDILGEQAGTQPESILYIAQPNHPKDVTRDRWKNHGPPAGLRIDTFENLASQWYKEDQYKGQVTHIDQPLLVRLQS